ncbi:AraC family transcriptional regulator [Actinomycetospora sp. SF1]|nr:helix-turn-helix transcriptional regulator [Actinomycetospora soli]MCD2187320.1 AraC family transcriptional regulator [Actinomycetospora soli]
MEALLGAVRVVEPELVVAEPSGRATLATGHRRSLVAVARGRVRALGTDLGPGDALLLHDAGSVPVVAVDPTTVVVARFALQGPARLLALPDEVLAPADSEFCRLLIERVADQAGTGAAAGDVVSARLLDWLVVETVRDVLLARGSQGEVADAAVAAALAALHADPAAPWSVAALADRAGVSRAAFARRFHDAVGTSPSAYVREHRLAVAEHALLTEPDVTVAAVARRVGYANPFSFSTAFRRHRGVAPSEVRAS